MLSALNRASLDTVRERQGTPPVHFGPRLEGLVEDIMTQARTEGEQAGVQKAEQAADGEIQRLESLLVAALAIIPDHLTVGELRREKTRQDSRRERLEAYADRRRRETEQARDRILQLEGLLRAAEAKLTGRRAVPLPTVCWVYTNGGRVRLEDLTDAMILETWPGRNPAEVRAELDDAALAAQESMFGRAQVVDDSPSRIPSLGIAGELTDAEIREFWPEADPDQVREQFAHLLAMADAVAKSQTGGGVRMATTDEATKGTATRPLTTVDLNTPLMAIARQADHIADNMGPGGEGHAIRALSRNIYNLAVSAAGRLPPSKIQEAKELAERLAAIQPNMIIPDGLQLDALKTLSSLVAMIAAAR